ncbi:MAG: phosphate ABC transporter permease subunit PstC [Oscillospiraceae bacterium]|nr:phosphate ABC transporter permease subunit PstC [Oscillospiraceae bacterium]
MERPMRVIFFIAALASILSVALICLFLFAQGIPAMSEIGVFKFLFGEVWKPNADPQQLGILPMILGSVYITGGAIIVGVPIGILVSLFMAKMCPKPLYRFLKPAMNLMAGIPSVIYGFFGMTVLVPLVKDIFGLPQGDSILTASVLLGIMILPTVITIAETNLRAVPQELYEGAVALGASHERAVFKIVLPAARSGVLAAAVLGVGRAVGETMAVRMVAGNQTLMRMPYDFLKGVRTLTANVIMEMNYAVRGSLHDRSLIATGVVLFVFILIINSLFSMLNADKKERTRKKRITQSGSAGEEGGEAR